MWIRKVSGWNANYDSLGLRWSTRFCMSNRLPDSADATPRVVCWPAAQVSSLGPTSHFHQQSPPSSCLGARLPPFLRNPFPPSQVRFTYLPLRRVPESNRNQTVAANKWWDQPLNFFLRGNPSLQMQCFSSSPRTGVLANSFVLWHLPASRNLINSNPKVNNQCSGDPISSISSGVSLLQAFTWFLYTGLHLLNSSLAACQNGKTLRVYGKQLLWRGTEPKVKVMLLKCHV